MSYTDMTLVCRDCGRQFTFSAGEQEYYSRKGFLNEPVRCPECRRARKKARQGNTSETVGQEQGYRNGQRNSGER
jgi:ssDNA-binding Zn-finger/Zn-ribbon topoisomerase 1